MPGKIPLPLATLCKTLLHFACPEARADCRRWRPQENETLSHVFWKTTAMTRSLLIAALLALGLTACGKKEETPPPPPPAAEAEKPAEAAPAAPAAEGEKPAEGAAPAAEGEKPAEEKAEEKK